MAYVTPTTRATGYVVLAANWNEFVNNFIAMAPDLFTTDGDIHIADGANSGVRLGAFTSSTGTLKHEQGGLEFDLSALTTNDGIGGASSGVAEIKVPVTQAEAEGGTNTRFSLWSSLRVKQAIDAGGTAPVFGRVVRTAGNITTTSTTLVDVTGASITFTTGAFPVAYGASSNTLNSLAGKDHRLNCLVDSTLQHGTVGVTFKLADASIAYSACYTGQSAALTAASHTIKLQWAVQGGTGTLEAGSAQNHVFWAHEIR